MKNIKKLLFVLLLIPCLLFAGCSQDISAQEFEVLRGDAATNYYQNYYGKNMTITARIDREMSGTQSVPTGKLHPMLRLSALLVIHLQWTFSRTRF